MFFRGLTRRLRSCSPALLGLIAALIALPASPAIAGSGASGFAEPGGHAGGKGTKKGEKGTKKPGKVKLGKSGDAVAPSGAPKEVVRVIDAANEINEKPYQYGGGHGNKKKNKGYDCSGAISYALRGGKMLKDPLDSGGFTKWGKKGEGDWISVYANSGHAYLTVGKLRFDTSSAGAARSQDGPRWYKEKAPKSGYKVRHPEGF